MTHSSGIWLGGNDDVRGNSSNLVNVCVFICAGEFGVVYRGSLSGWTTKVQQDLVAAKTLKGTM